MTQGYYRWPTVHQDKVVFVAEDDLWTVPLQGGQAVRLTANLGQILNPLFSPDGNWIAYIGSDEGHQEVYVLPSGGGAPKRRSFFGTTVTRIAGWKPDSSAIICNSSAQQEIRRKVELFEVSPEQGEPKKLGYGMAHHIDWGPQGGVVIGRHTWDPARWKRYKGGTKGVFWIDKDDSGTFELLLDIEGNLASPMWIGDRIYFLSDHEGSGNLYSCTPQGDDLTRHTHHEDFYVRFPSNDGNTLVYQCGGSLYSFDIASGRSQEITIEWNSPQVQKNRKFANAASYLQGHQLDAEGQSLAVISRGKPFSFPLFGGAVKQSGERDGVRYRAVQYLADNQRLALISDASGEEQLEVHTLEGSSEPLVVTDMPLGRPNHVVAAPKGSFVAIVNHKRQLMLVDADALTTRLLDESDQLGGIGAPAWSPDGEWIAYSFAKANDITIIKLCHAKTGSTHEITTAVYKDFSPSFDPDGKYLYFISCREFNPAYDEMHFSLGFPYGTRPYLITLQNDLRSPFQPDANMLINTKDSDDEKDKDEEDESETLVHIDLEGIQNRVVAFPVKDGRYRKVLGIKGKAMYITYPVYGSLDQAWDESVKVRGTLRAYNLEKREEETLMDGLNSFYLSGDSKKMLLRADNKLRVLKAGEKPSDKVLSDSKPGEKSGWINLSRISLAVTPTLEWEQMYHDAWRRMRDHFWTEDMSGVDWDEVRQRYLSVLAKVACRSEFSDLLWEVQGELGTSHAYENGGDYRPEPQYKQGHLGADFEWDQASAGYRLTHLVSGDHWDAKRGGPLVKPGLNIKEGDVLTAINGLPLSASFTPEEALVNQSKTDVLLAFGGENSREVQVRTIGSDLSARYRDWVEKNRDYVHGQSNGRIGYVHIPDMGPAGFAEFHRYYLVECNYDALLVDVRFNGGGHVSQLLLDKLARKRLGYDKPRWGQAESYPSYSVMGPILCLTDENAGSDGDIFSHSFKMMKLGPLVGKRTWGGVIGIDSQGRLVDGSLTTQPEYSFWFHDVGWGVENYGTDPDIEVEYAPHHYKQGIDPQLDRSIEELMQMLMKNPPVMPDLTRRPSLKRQPLPPA